MRKFGEGAPAQVSSSSSDRGSKLRGPSQNIPRVASIINSREPDNEFNTRFYRISAMYITVSNVKYVVVGHLNNFGMEVLKAECRFLYLVVTVNYEGRPKIAFVLFRNETLIKHRTF
ncbi:hypothetical protein AVEN_118155-1 [Araneus ventricosus]|uniref:Uncharacterized protein n=1 Tax=Araneus ventricosus TaxID=182803 RepID=A0A4Y2NQS7_ARAVE|nr:hypothetical protein AVEN_118155-1 [Araneus ventricosus]